MDEVTKNYLPEWLKDIGGNVTAANLKCAKTSDGRYHHTYTVSWSGQRQIASKASGKQPPQTFVGFWDFLKKWMPASTVPSAPTAARQDSTLARCDGPCDSFKPARTMKTFGICEHAICPECLENRPRISTQDGGSGCPNLQCYEDDLEVVRCKKQRSQLKSAKKESAVNCPVTRVRCDQSCTEPDKCQLLQRAAYKDVTMGREKKSPSVTPDESIRKAEATESFIACQSSAMKIINVKIIEEKGQKYMTEEVPGDYTLLEALTMVLRNSSWILNRSELVDKVMKKDVLLNKWIPLADKDFDTPVKRLDAVEELYLAVEVPSCHNR